MKHVAVMGAGYAGLAVSVGLAHFGAAVRCFDIDTKKIEQLLQGNMPFHEPEMEEMLRRGIEEGRLSFSSDIAGGFEDADVIFIAVGTPGQGKGAPDVSAVFAAADMIGQQISHDVIVVIKSTVPVGTCEAVQARLQERTGGAFSCEVVANPEFLREGQALHDFLQPDRIVLGARSDTAIAVMRELYAPLISENVPIYATDWQTAELIKYSANSFLAMKVAFINEIARMCDVMGADVEVVAAALGTDPRIGSRHLKPGPGYGGSCLPKDTEALALSARQAGERLSIVEAVIESNRRQQEYIVEKIKHKWPDLHRHRIAVLGLAFKADTDDMRESPAIPIIDRLLAEGAEVVVYDPKAVSKAQQIWGAKIRYSSNAYEAAEGAHALLVLTEWAEFLELRPDRLTGVMAEKTVFDFRNLYSRTYWEAYGFYYMGIGK